MYFTKRQIEVLDTIRQFIARQRVAPTLDELAAILQVSRVTAFEHVRALEKKGVLRRTPNRARSIELVAQDDGAPDLTLPILGRVDADAPSVPFEQAEAFDVARWIQPPGDFHLLRVQGDSMIEEHIQEGDLVLVDRRRTPTDGDLVVAALPNGEGVTLKRIYRDSTAVRLHPAKVRLQPMIYASADVRGVVVGLIRRI